MVDDPTSDRQGPRWSPPDGDVADPELRAPADPAWAPLPADRWRGTGPEQGFPVPFSVVDGFGLAAWSLLGAFVFSQFYFLVALAVADGPLTFGVAITVTVLAQLSAVALAAVYLRRRGKLTWRLLGPERPGWRHVLPGIAVGVLGFLVIQFAIGLLAELAGEVQAPDQSLVREFRRGSGATAVAVVFTATVLAPTVEELVFRGVLFQALRRRLGLWPGAIISGLVFGVVHVEVVTGAALPAVLVAVAVFTAALLPAVPLPTKVAFVALGFAALGWVVVVVAAGPVIYTLGLAALGVLFAWAFHRTGSLLVPILGHVAFNATSLVLLAVAG